MAGFEGVDQRTEEGYVGMSLCVQSIISAWPTEWRVTVWGDGKAE